MAPAITVRETMIVVRRAEPVKVQVASAIATTGRPPGVARLIAAAARRARSAAAGVRPVATMNAAGVRTGAAGAGTSAAPSVVAVLAGPVVRTADRSADTDRPGLALPLVSATTAVGGRTAGVAPGPRAVRAIAATIAAVVSRAAAGATIGEPAATGATAAGTTAVTTDAATTGAGTTGPATTDPGTTVAATTGRPQDARAPTAVTVIHGGRIGRTVARSVTTAVDPAIGTAPATTAETEPHGTGSGYRRDDGGYRGRNGSDHRSGDAGSRGGKSAPGYASSDRSEHRNDRSSFRSDDRGGYNNGRGGYRSDDRGYRGGDRGGSDYRSGDRERGYRPADAGRYREGAPRRYDGDDRTRRGAVDRDGSSGYRSADRSSGYRSDDRGSRSPGGGSTSRYGASGDGRAVRPRPAEREPGPRRAERRIPPSGASDRGSESRGRTGDRYPTRRDDRGDRPSSDRADDRRSRGARSGQEGRDDARRPGGSASQGRGSGDRNDRFRGDQRSERGPPAPVTTVGRHTGIATGPHAPRPVARRSAGPATRLRAGIAAMSTRSGSQRRRCPTT